MNKKRIFTTVLAASLVFGSVPAVAANFTDINDVPWDGAKTYINAVAEAGLMVGDYDLQDRLVFRPRDIVSYCETMQLIYALNQKNSGQTVATSVLNKWTSVMNGYKIPTWAQPAIAYGLENNIITISDIPGFVDSSGNASVKATRQDVAMMFGRALQSYGTLQTNPTLSYNDSSAISSVAVPYVDLLTNLNIVSGDDLGNFNPKNTINRAEMSVIVSKSNELMGNKSTSPQQTGSITGTVTSTTTAGAETILTIKDSTSGSSMTLKGSAAVPCVNPSSQRVLISSIEEGYSIIASYSGETINSILITNTSSSSGGSTSTKETTVKGTFASLTSGSMKIKVDGKTETYYFKGDYYDYAEFLVDGSKSTYTKFKNEAEVGKSLELTLNSDKEIIKADIGTKITGTYSSMSSSQIKIKIDGTTNTYDFENEKVKNVEFKINGKTKTQSEFEKEAKNSTVELKFNDDGEVIEVNIVGTSSSSDITGTFRSISKSELELKVSGSNKTYEYPDDSTSNTTFYVDGKKVSYSEFRDEVSSGDSIRVVLDKNKKLDKVYLEDDDDNGNADFTGTVVSIKSTYITVKKSSSSSEKDYDYKDESRNSVDFYYNGKSVSYSDITSKYSRGDYVKLYTNSKDEVIKVYISDDDDDDDDNDSISGKLNDLSKSDAKIGSKTKDFANDVTYKITDGKSTITSYSDLNNAVKDGKTIEITKATLNSKDKITKLTGYVSYAEGEIKSLSSNSIKIRSNETNTDVTYNFKNSKISIYMEYDDGGSNYDYSNLEIAYKDNKYKVDVELTINSSGEVTEINAYVWD